MHITLIAGARPNFMKIAALVHAIEKYNEGKPTPAPSLNGGEQEWQPVQYRLVHTGQHYDKNMSDTFFEELGIPAPDVNLGCGGGTQAEQTAAITLRDNTERPETCTIGTNELIGTNPDAVAPALRKLFAGEWKKGAIPPLWDGHAAERIISVLADL